MRNRSTAAVLLLLVATAVPAAAEWQIDRQRSTFAVLTHRDGIAARLAHDHLIIARGAEVELQFDAEEPTRTTFTFTLPVLALDVDPDAERAALEERLTLLGALTDKLPPVDEQDREKVRRAMLDSRQLFAERFSEVRAELVALERRGGGANARVALGWNARVRITIRGKAVEKTFPARWEFGDGEVTAEILGEANFSDFDIQPYSAVLGAIRNADLFHIYVNVVAKQSP